MFSVSFDTNVRFCNQCDQGKAAWNDFKFAFMDIWKVRYYGKQTLLFLSAQLNFADVSMSMLIYSSQKTVIIGVLLEIIID